MDNDSWIAVVSIMGGIIVALISATIPALFARAARREAKQALASSEAVRVSLTTNNGGSTMLDKMDAIFRVLGEQTVKQEELRNDLSAHITEERAFRSVFRDELTAMKSTPRSSRARSTATTAPVGA